jgi:hypothetical protein
MRRQNNAPTWGVIKGADGNVRIEMLPQRVKRTGERVVKRVRKRAGETAEDWRRRAEEEAAYAS